MALALVVSTIFAFRCMFISLKFEQEHPILKKRTSPLKSSQFALAPMDARLQLKNDRDKAKFFLFAFFIVVCLLEVIRGLMSPSPNMRVVNSFYILLVLQLLMGFIALRNLRHYPLGFEAVANAEGLTIHRMRRQPEHFTWYEIQEASLVERFTNWGERASLSLVLLSANDGKRVASIQLSLFKTEDAARFQSVVARYLKPLPAS